MKEESKHIQTANYVSIKKKYFDEVFAPAFEKVSREIVPIEKYYRIANVVLCLRFYSHVLETRLSKAFVHNEIEKQDRVDYTINLWDTKESGIIITPPWTNPDYIFDQKVDAQTTTSEQWKGVYLNGQEVLPLLDLKNKVGYFWTYDAALLPGWVDASPIRTLLHWILSESDTHLIHGAVMGMNNKSVLLSAKGGSGKSTTALSCFELGMDYLADDYVAVKVKDGSAIAYSLYNSVKVIEKEGEEKTVMFLSEKAPTQIKQEASLHAILIPRITHSKKTDIIPATKTEAFLALAPTTLFQLPLADSTKITSLKRVIESTPCYFLNLSEDRREVAQTIKNFLL
jgi:hypothetical protein